MNFSMLENFLKFILLLKLQLAVLSSQKESMWLSKIVTPGNLASLGKRYRVCTPCGNDEANFHFPQQILVETICKRQ